MELERAQIIANQVKEKLEPYCERIETAGSIRRRRPWVKDIDLVCIPKNQGQFVYQLRSR
jgi:DNA polymerase/3'-5' exonuclease PolX